MVWFAKCCHTICLVTFRFFFLFFHCRFFFRFFWSRNEFHPQLEPRCSAPFVSPSAYTQGVGWGGGRKRIISIFFEIAIHRYQRPLKQQTSALIPTPTITKEPRSLNSKISTMFCSTGEDIRQKQTRALLQRHAFE